MSITVFVPRDSVALALDADAPAAMVDGVLHARVTPEKFDRLVKKMGCSK